MLRGRFLLLVGLATWALATPSLAGTMTFSTMVSEQPYLAQNGYDCGTPGHDPCIQADWLDATVEITVDNDLSQVTIMLTNDTGQGGDPTFDINQFYFSVAPAVTSLSLFSVTHSVEGAVSWTLGSGAVYPANGQFGQHDYSLKDGVGLSPDMAGPGETVTFVLDFTSTGDLVQEDFIQFTPDGETPTTGVLKFVNGDPSVFTYAENDSAFGAVPEPGTAAMVALGLFGLGYAGRRRRNA